MSAAGRVFAALGGIALAWCLAGLCGRDIGRMPQVVRGEGALAVAFGDARETISRAFVGKADSYFHGGIDIDCGHLGHHCHDEHCEGECHEHDHGHAHGLDHAAEHETANESWDLWRWINVHVCAPQEHRHLDGEKSVELMPWLWASVKANPHNIEAWTTTWYIANNMLKDKELALRVVAEGLEKNPDNPELLICRGRTIYDRGHGDLAAAHAAFVAAAASADGMLQRGGDETDERILQARDFAQAYIDEIAKKRGPPPDAKE